MTSLPLLIYAANVLPNLQVTLYLLCIPALGAAALWAGIRSEAREPDYTGPFRLAVIITPIMIAIATLIPNQTTIYLMAAAHFTPEALQLPEVQKLREIINIQLDQLVP